MSLLEQLPQGARVCLIRLRSLGDCVLTTPAIALLKQARPDLRVSVVVEPRFEEIFAGNPNVETTLSPDWRIVRSSKPDLIVNLHGGSRSIWMTALSGAPWRAGFSHHSFTFAYNLRIGRAQRILGVNRTVHTAEHLASAFFSLGVPFAEIPRANLFAEPSPIEGRYAVLHPFASASEKQWPAERFLELGRFLALCHIEPIFLAGPEDDAAIFESQRVFRGSLPEVKSLLSAASVFIGNDSGPAHMAAAFGIPSVVLFGPSNPVIWGPWRTEAEIIIDPDGLAQVTVSRVVAALERMPSLQEALA